MKYNSCINCAKVFEASGKKCFCCKGCQNTYNSRILHRARSKTVFLDNCKRCEKPIKRPRRCFCSKECKDLWNNSKKYYNKYSVNYQTRTPLNFLSSLLGKKERRKHGLTKEDMFDIYTKQNGKCALTGIEMTYIRKQGRVHTNMSIDRIDSNKGYSKDNVWIVCAIVNLMKSIMPVDELKAWCKLILEYNGTQVAS